MNLSSGVSRGDSIEPKSFDYGLLCSSRYLLFRCVETENLININMIINMYAKSAHSDDSLSLQR